MTAFDIAVCVGSAGLSAWFIVRTVRNYRRRQAEFNRNFYERWPPPPPAPRRESARRQIISPSWGTGKTRGSASSSPPCVSDSDSWSLMGSALSGITDSPAPAEPAPAPFHGGGGSFGGAGASGSWDAPATTSDTTTSSDTGGSADGGGGSSD